MTRDQVRQNANAILGRDISAPLWPGLTESDWAEDAFEFARACLALLAELERAERERDEWKQQAREWADASIENGEKADKLNEALREVCDLAIWMSGSDSFAPDGEARNGWVKNRPKLDRALNALAAWESE